MRVRDVIPFLLELVDRIENSICKCISLLVFQSDDQPNSNNNGDCHCCPSDVYSRLPTNIWSTDTAHEFEPSEWLDWIFQRTRWTPSWFTHAQTTPLSCWTNDGVVHSFQYLAFMVADDLHPNDVSLIIFYSLHLFPLSVPFVCIQCFHDAND